MASSIPEQSMTSLRRRFPWKSLVIDLLFLLVLAGGAYFRTVGTDWDQGQHLHPDERFLTLVEGAIRPVDSLKQYFDTANSPLNPHNVGYTFYVYGTLPLFIIRYVTEWTGQSGYGQLYLVGRTLSAVADLLTVFLVYLIAGRLYGRRAALLAGAFSAFAVLQIQLSHYMTVDTFTNLFTFAAFYFAVRIAFPEEEPESGALGGKTASRLDDKLPPVTGFLLFGAMLGLAMASKVSAVPLAVVLPAAVGIFYVRRNWEDPNRAQATLLFYMILAAVTAFLVFRIGQPYAFSGPGFFGLKPNPLWIANLKELSNQALSDVPWALQWARRPLTFAWTNMVKWGLGLPLGILAWAAFLGMGWRIIKGEWQRHALVWAWTLAYFVWQSTNFSRSMRYQLLVYPTLAIIAGWGLVRLWEAGKKLRLRSKSGSWLQGAAILLIVVSVGGTLAWAFAFTRIYTKDITRVQASDWILENVPGPLNFVVETAQGEKNMPLPYRAGTSFSMEQPYVQAFSPAKDGFVLEVTISNLWDAFADPRIKNLTVQVMPASSPDQILGTAVITDVFSFVPGGRTYTTQFLNPINLKKSESYILRIGIDVPAISMQYNGLIDLKLVGQNGLQIGEQPALQELPPPVQRINPMSRYTADYTVTENGTLKQVTIPHMVDQTGSDAEKTLRLTVTVNDPTAPALVGSAEVSGDFLAKTDARGEAYTFTLDQSIPVETNKLYTVNIDMVRGYGEVGVYGSWPVNESTFDDALPLYGTGYAAYGETAYIYRGDLKFESYWPDNPDKHSRYQSMLDQSDYIFISSNRQWGTTVRVPERYPLTTLFYRELIGCPADKDILWCYQTAKPGMFFERLGYKLIAVFQSDPKLGTLEINDQSAEEAFTVYDHPKVLIFKKQPGYDPVSVEQVLSTVDYSLITNLVPFEFKLQSENLMLPPTAWSIQQRGGTWFDLFDPAAWFNRYPGLGAVLWYLAVLLLGWIVYPLVRLALPGLSDRGYPLARTAGLVILAFLVWLGGSLGWQVDRLMITQVILILVVIGAGLAYLQREEIGKMIRQRSRYILLVEAVALVFFAIDLLIRIGNPDLWHPAYGGEKPMDFSYFNAVLKSSTFPPYDPWFAGGYINYYYYGYMIAAVLVKWLGIVPATAYNLLLPTLFSLVALGAFSAGWNLIAHSKEKDPLWMEEEALPTATAVEVGQGVQQYAASAERVNGPVQDGYEDTLEEVDDPDEDYDEEDAPPLVRIVPFRNIVNSAPFWVGLAAAIGIVLLGNLGTVRMMWTGVQRLAAPNGVIDNASILQQIGWAARGTFSYLSGTDLPYSVADWYWKPSRAIQPEAGNEITEFPFFTFLYGDLHAHLIALPLTLLLLGILLSIVLSHTWWKEKHSSLSWISTAAGILLTALTLGALRPTNTWDFYTYLILTGAAVLFGDLTASDEAFPAVEWLSGGTRRLLRSILLIGAIIGLAVLLYSPFSSWYHQAYNTVITWKGAHTHMGSYLTHWGLFLFMIVSWMIAETRQWLASTPMSALLKLKPYRIAIQVGAVGVLAGIAALIVKGISVGWLVVVLGVWAAVLIFRPGQSAAKQVVLFLTGSALALTLFVELFVLQGDIGRMNTVFKFYLQAWIFLGASAAASLYWFLEIVEAWKPRWSSVWGIAAAALVVGASLYPLTAGLAKIRDRMVPSAPRGLDGMAYMQTAKYAETWGTMDLGQDYKAIRWLQEHVIGSPVIVEANNRALYRWGSRMTIYTGLPGVVGWEWHQQQQRAVLPGTVITNRILEIEDFFRTTDPEAARAFLAKYNVGYIILGQQERGMYAGPGLDKFSGQEGILWQEVYRDGDTVIYQSACKCGAD